MTANSTPALVIIGAEGPALYGIAMSERIARQMARAGVTQRLTREEAERHEGRIILVRGDAALDQPLVPVLAETPGLLLIGEGAQGEAPLAANVEAMQVAQTAKLLLAGEVQGPGLAARRPSELDVKFWKALRKRETPYALAVSPA